jgi:cellulose synthase/poly-beta-1,6-N-acetylglucosamine synthase-like glycosyltransferase
MAEAVAIPQQRYNPRLVLALVCFGLFLIGLSHRGVLVSLPTLAEEFRTDLSFIQWVLLVYDLAVIGLVHVRNRIEHLRPVDASERPHVRVRADHLERQDRGTQFQIIAEATIEITNGTAERQSYNVSVIVNDGSRDNTLEKAIEAYSLVKVNYAFQTEIPCAHIRGVYKSTRPRYSNLLLVDKENGGKADALNAGINVANARYVACIDVDCILEQDALLKLVKPFMQHKTRVIATGGVIRIANSCRVESGKVTDVRVPGSFIPRVQVLEYLRAFLLGRMAWSKLDGLLLISGAFGMFDREVLIRAGGYNLASGRVQAPKTSLNRAGYSRAQEM